MASIKVKFRESTQPNREGVIYYQLIHNKVIKQLGTKYKIYADEWGKETMQIIILQTNNQRLQYLSIIRDRIKLEVARLQKIVDNLTKRGAEYSVNDIISTFKKQQNSQSLVNFMQRVISHLRELRKERTSETYTTTLNSFMRFREGEDILLSDISSDLLMSYEAYLKYNSASMNTISFYMRILRAVYNRAVEKNLIEQQHPFKRVYTGIDKTVKRALPLKNIKQIKELNLSAQPHLEFARDIFMLSFYMRGMSFVDMAYLRKKDLQNGIVIYRRRKTGQQLHIKLEKCMQKIVNHYSNNDTQYLLPIIKQSERAERLQYKNALYSINNGLKQIARILYIPIPLTMYVARHSWASAAKSKSIPISVISEGMGHNSEATTQIYLASLDTAIVDKANMSIIKLLL